MEHITVFRQQQRYAGWPANYGIWCWGNEIVLGFTLGYFSLAGGFHTRDKNRPFVTMQARSLDGGQTWQTCLMPCRTPGGRALSADEHMTPELQAARILEQEGPIPACPGGSDFSHPAFALMCARTGLHVGATSWFYLSLDRCHSWQGPYRLPMFDLQGIAARTDYIISGCDECTLWLTAAKSTGQEGRVFTARTQDGGHTWRFLSWVTPEPQGFAIMPASLRLPSGRILTAVRCHESALQSADQRNWIDLYASDDGGTSWQLLNQPVGETGQGGNPPTLTRLHDGRLCITYGYRAAPFGIRAVLSSDDGKTWGDQRILRDDGGCQDLGYPRTIQRPDGALVTAYYWNDRPDGDRYIAATIWQP